MNRGIVTLNDIKYDLTDVNIMEVQIINSKKWLRTGELTPDLVPPKNLKKIVCCIIGYRQLFRINTT